MSDLTTDLLREAKIRYQNTFAPTCPPGHDDIVFLLKLLDEARQSHPGGVVKATSNLSR